MPKEMYDVWVDVRDPRLSQRTPAKRNDPKPSHIPPNWEILYSPLLDQEDIKNGKF